MQAQVVKSSAETCYTGLTIQQLLDAVSRQKRMSVRTLYANITTLGIKPLGARQIPQLYPPDTAQRILARYGLTR